MEDKQYIAFKDGRVGYIKNICTCEKCKERGAAEVFINDLNGDYLDCLKVNDDAFKHSLLYFGDNITDALNILASYLNKDKEIEYLAALLDYYSQALVK